MVAKNGKDIQLENLLKKVFQDDLPSGVEKGMKDLLIRFREEIGQVTQESSRKRESRWPRIFPAGSWVIPEWAFPRRVLAFSSVLMVMLGGFFHISGTRPALADSLSFLNTLVSLSNQVREVRAMECRLQVANAAGQHRQFLIRWQLPGLTRVDAYEDGQAQKTLWMEDSAIIVADCIHPGWQRYRGLGQLDDPLFLPISEFLTPEQIATAIYREWEPRMPSEGDKHRQSSYLCVDKRSRALLEITVDPKTHLPLTIRQSPSDPNAGIHREESIRMVEFCWGKPMDPQSLVPPSPMNPPNTGELKY